MNRFWMISLTTLIFSIYISEQNIEHFAFGESSRRILPPTSASCLGGESLPLFTDVSPRASSTTNQPSTSGRILALAQSGDRLYAATPIAGLFVSSNSGDQWSQLQFTNSTICDGKSLPGPTIVDVAVDPDDPNRVLAVSGWTNDAHRTGAVAGLYLSTDGGKSWKRSTTWQADCPSKEPSVTEGVMFVRSGVAVAWGGCQIAISTDGGESFTASSVRDGSGRFAPIRQVIVDRNSNVGYACGPGCDGTTPQFWSTSDFTTGIWNFRSTQVKSSGSLSVNNGRWCGSNSPDTPGFWRALAMNPRNPSIVYAAVRTEPQATIWKADFSEASPTFTNLAFPFAVPASNSGTVTVMTQPHRSAPGFLMFFNNADWLFASEGEPLSGFSWYQMTRDSNTKTPVHADTHALAVDKAFDMTIIANEVRSCDSALSSRLLWAGTDGGVYKTQTCGKAWINNGGGQNGLSNLAARVLGTAFDANRQVISFGGQDNADYVTVDAGRSWFGPQGSNCRDCGDWFSDTLDPTWIMTIDRSDMRVYSQSRLVPPLLPVLELEFSRTRPKGVIFNSTFDAVPIRSVIQTLPSELPADSERSKNCPSTQVRTTRRDAVWIQEITINPFTGSGLLFLVRSSNPANVLARSRIIRWLPPGSFGIQPSGGHTNTFYYIWNLQNKSLFRFQEGRADEYLVGGDAKSSSPQAADIFFVNPYVPNEVWIVDSSGMKPGIKRGQRNETTEEWQWFDETAATETATAESRFTRTCAGCLGGFGCNCLINDMLFVPGEKTRFIAGKAGVFYTVDGLTWQRLFSAEQIPGMPWHLAFDRCSRTGVRSLYVSFLGRGVLRFDNIPVPGKPPIN